MCFIQYCTRDKPAGIMRITGNFNNIFFYSTKWKWNRKIGWKDGSPAMVGWTPCSLCHLPNLLPNHFLQLSRHIYSKSKKCMYMIDRNNAKNGSTHHMISAWGSTCCSPALHCFFLLMLGGVQRLFFRVSALYTYI